MNDFNQSALDELAVSLQQCLISHRPEFSRLLGQIKRRVGDNKPADKLIKKLSDQIEQSCSIVAARKALIPEINYPDELPIADRRDEIADMIRNHQVVVVAGETGSGKTTQLPKICLDIGQGVYGMIGHTQPRRIAARSVANRIAEEIGDDLGERIGYQVRFTDHSSDKTLVKLMTDGILLGEIQSDPLLSRYDTLIIDEAHERSLNIDFLLGYIRQILPKRPDLKVIITSATIDVEKFSAHFSDAPIIEVSGRTYPVEIIYREAPEDEDLSGQITSVVEEILALPDKGDILVFLSGEREIREVASAIRRGNFRHVDVLPLYARLSLAEQTRVFKPHSGIRVVLATNVAETSLTVPGIRYVIDPGFARISRYSYKNKVQRLPIEAISKASANQRAGRCGRVAEGICYRLYDEEDFLGRADFTDAEILRTNLAAVILKMLNLRLGDIRHFPFVDKPDNRLINDGFNLLQEIRAVDGGRKLNALGRTVARFPLDPRLSAMLVAASEKGALRELLVIVSALSVQDPRERPADKQQAADERHGQWRDADSDFVTLLNLWNHLEEKRQTLSRNQFDKYCRSQFISPMRVREWRDLHHQLHTLCRQSGLSDKGAAGYDSIHQSILAGLLTQIGRLSEGREFEGTRNRKFHVFPGSGLAKKPPKWIVAAEFIETSRLFSHFNARINPEWLPGMLAHLVKKHHSEPHYSAKRGQVMAWEKQTLNGLTVVDRKRVAYDRINPELSREIFIRAALVEGEYRGKGEFFTVNRRLIQEIEDLENRFRRKDILVSDEVVFDFYEQRIPADICSLRRFDSWRKQAEKDRPDLLFLDRNTVANLLPGNDDIAQFPDVIEWQGAQYALTYRFEPGHAEDGVSVDIPVEIVHQIPESRFEWLVPGLLRDKVISLIKALPKQYRKHFVPVPAFADKAMQGLKPGNQPLREALAFQLKRHTGIDLPDESWSEATLDPFYRMNFRLIDNAGKVVATGRDLPAMKERYRGAFQAAVSSMPDKSIERSDIQCWDFGELPAVYRVKGESGHHIEAWPTLIVEGDVVQLKLMDSPTKADFFVFEGLARLAMKAFPQNAKYLRKQLFKNRDLAFTAAGAGKPDDWRERLILRCYADVFRGRSTPRNADAFRSIFEQFKADIVPAAMALEKLVSGWLDKLITIRKQARELKPNARHGAEDIEAQIRRLFSPGRFLRAEEFWLQQYSRYLSAVEQRLEKLPRQVARDIEMTSEFQSLLEPLETVALHALSATARKELDKYLFMLEEYRVSVFAQQLGTVMPVSRKRLAKQWDIFADQN